LAGLCRENIAMGGRRVATADESPIPTPAAGTSENIVIHLDLPLNPYDIAALCERLDNRLRHTDVNSVACDASAMTDPDVTTVEALARLQLTAQRNGCSLSLQQAPRQLLDLLRLTGLADVVTAGSRSAFEPGRQIEQGEQAGVHEVVEPGDSSG
jgi:ABC-type transporter Mla MlaB component